MFSKLSLYVSVGSKNTHFLLPLHCNKVNYQKARWTVLKGKQQTVTVNVSMLHLMTCVFPLLNERVRCHEKMNISTYSKPHSSELFSICSIAAFMKMDRSRLVKAQIAFQKQKAKTEHLIG